MCVGNAGSPDVETRTVGTRLMYFMSVLTHFTIFPLGDFLHIFTEIAASTLPPPPPVAALEVPPVEEDGHGEERRPE